ncbi:MAG: hypothetical protein EOP06_07040 [Proteobacteria bacterium]|nr:MAG: hypothetical protein EOP06_07040 [Pseudomonadota bacterium]
MKSLSRLFVSIVLVYFGSLTLGVADEENNLRIKGYLQMAYDKKMDIDRQQPPKCSSGVKAIARMQNRSKLGTKEGISDAVAIASEYIDSSPTTWESDFLRLGLALNYAALGDSESAAKSAEDALARNDFKRLQVYPDAALQWLRESIGNENFSRSCQDSMHQVAASYYMDFAESPEHDTARRHIEAIGHSKLRDSLLKQLSYRKSGSETDVEGDLNGSSMPSSRTRPLNANGDPQGVRNSDHAKPSEKNEEADSSQWLNAVALILAATAAGLLVIKWRKPRMGR